MLEEAKFKLKTALEVSESCYQHCHIFPMYGMPKLKKELTHQQSGSSSASYCLVSIQKNVMVQLSKIHTAK
jgi:hypothetical protein